MIIKLPDAFGLLVAGKDSERYLNARLTAPVKFMKVGDTLPAAALNAQGKVESFLRVKRLDEFQFLLVVDGGEVEPITRFKVADRVEFIRLPHLVYHSTEGGEAEYRIPSKRVSDDGEDLLVLSPLIENSTSEEFHYKRVLYGTPQYPIEFNGKVLFSEYPIPDAISFKKGCYVGQEVVEKIDALGETPKVIVRFKTKVSSLQKTNQILSSYEKDGDVVGFARVSREDLDQFPYELILER